MHFFETFSINKYAPIKIKPVYETSLCVIETHCLQFFLFLIFISDGNRRTKTDMPPTKMSERSPSKR